MRKVGLMVVAVGLLMAADAKDDAVKKELKAFEGTWTVTAMEIDGQQLPADTFKGTTLVLKGDHFTYTDANGKTEGSFKVDPTAKPKTIDITFLDGPQKGQSMLGVYELDGDTYKICLKPMGKERPTELSAKKDSGNVLETLKRDKK